MEDEGQKTERYQKSQAVAAESNYTELLERSAIDEAEEDYGGVQNEQDRRQSLFRGYGHTRLVQHP